MNRFVGLDVHKRVIEVCIIGLDGKTVLRERIACDREAILNFAHARLTLEDAVVLEATTNTWAVVELLRPLVARVVVSNPLKTRAIADAKVKTDKIDAMVLAQLLRADFLPTVWIPDAATQRMRRLCHRRASLTGDLTAAKNRIQGVLHQQLLHPPGVKLFSKEGLAWLRAVEFDPDSRAAIEADLRLLHAVKRERDELDQTISTLAYADRRVRLLMTLPGFGVTVAAAVVAAWGDPGRFEDADRAAAYLGLAPSTRESAGKPHHGRITKQGSANARWLLVQAAQHAGRHAGPIGVAFRRLCKRKNRNVALVACARRLARIAWHMLRNDEPYRYAMPSATRTKLAALRCIAAGVAKPNPAPRRSSPAAMRGKGADVIITPPLNDVLAAEGLGPAATPGQLPAGEQRMLRERQLDEFAREVHTARYTMRRPRKSKQTGKIPTTSLLTRT